MINISGTIIRGAILDMDGVLWRGGHLLCDIESLFENFRTHQIDVALATNNGLRTIDQYIEKFKKFNIKINPSQVISSVIATAELVRKAFPGGGPIYIMGEKALFTTMEEFGFFHSEDKPQAVVAGMLTTKLTYENIKKTSLKIQQGLPFYFTNPDPTYPSTEGLLPGAGTTLAALETASGVKATLAGKPFPFAFQVAMEHLNTKPDETLVIGDRLTTDIMGGQNAGCRTALVLSGVSTMDDYKAWEPKPDRLLKTIMELFQDQ